LPWLDAKQEKAETRRLRRHVADLMAADPCLAI
jgi:hypothetical protein